MKFGRLSLIFTLFIGIFYTYTVSGQICNIVNKDTTICKGATMQLKVDVNTLGNSGWELLIPSTSYIGSQSNFQYAGFDPKNSILYSVLKTGSTNRAYAFDLNSKMVTNIPMSGGPGELYDFAFDFTNNRIVGKRVGRDAVFALPLTGGTWTSIGSGSFDAESYGSAAYWNPVSNRFGFFGGYGFFSVKNWLWESNSGGAWVNPYVNNNNCNPAKRTGQIARNGLGNKLYLFSGQGSCDGNQRAASCNLGSAWATDIGKYC